MIARNSVLSTVCIILQIVNGAFAFTTSELQTVRIIKRIKAFNIPALLIMGGGLMAAIIGTFAILKIVKKGARQVEQNNNILRRMNSR